MADNDLLYYTRVMIQFVISMQGRRRRGKGSWMSDEDDGDGGERLWRCGDGGWCIAAASLWLSSVIREGL